MRRHLQEQGRLADARIASEERDRTHHKAPAQHPIELILACSEAFALSGHRARKTVCGRRGCPAGACAAGGEIALFQGIPSLAVRALALPFRRLGAAGAARKDAGGSSHGAITAI